jgi:hypothetical protein
MPRFFSSLIPLSVWLLVPAATRAGDDDFSRPPCRTVMREVNREVSAREGHHASPRMVARTLGTEPEWVLRCMEAYGRLPSARGRLSRTDREALDRAVEEGRPLKIDEQDPEPRYEQRSRQRVERQELRERRRRLAQEKEFQNSSDPFSDAPGLGVPNY